MSRAFVKDGDDQWLNEIAPTLNALVVFLTRENNDIRVYEIRNYLDRGGRTVYEMSNGQRYAVDPNRQWQLVEEK